MKILKRFTNWLKEQFSQPDHLKEYRLEIIKVLNVVKTVVNSDVTSAIVAITKTKTDDKILIMIRQWLPRILQRWNLSGSDDLHTSVTDAVVNIQDMPEEKHGSYYLTIAGDLYTNFSGLPLDTAMEQIQETYNEVQLETIA